MSAPNVNIGELRVRASGLTREQARRLGEFVAKRIAESSIAASPARTIPSIHLTVSPASSLEGTAERVASQLRRRLK